MDLIKDTIMKCLVYEISCIRNLQYDIDKIFQRVENIEKTQDITTFINENKSDKPVCSFFFNLKEILIFLWYFK